MAGLFVVLVFVDTCLTGYLLARVREMRGVVTGVARVQRDIEVSRTED